MMSLYQSPRNRRLRIVSILGGEEMRRRLFALGFHQDDVIEVDSQAILKGPLLVKNLTSDMSVAIGRGIAQKILVEVMPDEK
jgi:Fe2+ transport system protein FeoA